MMLTSPALRQHGLSVPSCDVQRSGIPCLYVVLAMLFCVVGRGRADIVSVEGKPMSVGVTVFAMQEGRLYYRLPSGREVERPVEQIKFLQVTGWDAFNEAEKLQQAGQWRAATDAYERIPENAGPVGALGKLDRNLLVRCRLLRAYDEDGRFDKAVAAYLDLAERMPAAAGPLRPRKLPAAGSTFLAPAAAAVDEFLARHRGTQIGLSVAQWRQSWPGPAGTGAAASAPAESDGTKQLRSELAGIESLIAANRFDEALRKLEPLQNDKAGLLRPKIFYWQGRAWLGKSAGRQATDAQRDARRAGLAFMRVAIHFPGNPLAPECLFRAAQICQQAGQQDSAAGLWSEVVRSYPAGQPWTEQARQGLAGTTPGAASQRQ